MSLTATSTASSSRATNSTIDLQMEVVSAIDQISTEHLQVWRQLADNPMSSPDWLLPWWKHYGGPNDQLQLILFCDGDKLVAVSPLYLERGAHFKMLGSGQVCSDHCELFVGQSELLPQVETLFLRWLQSDQSPNWKSLQLEALSINGSTAPMMLDWNDKFSVCTTTGDFICTIELPESWDQYLKNLSKNHRKRVRRWTRNHLESGQVEIRSTNDNWDIDEAYESLIRLHNLRRSTLPSKGAFENETFCNFHREAIKRLAANGQAALSAIFLAGEAVAIEYELYSKDTVFAYQSGVDISVELSSPGSISILSRLQAAMKDGKKKFDLMRGNEGYKDHWQAQCVSTCNIVIWPKDLSGTTSKVTFHTKRRIRGVARIVRNRLLRRGKQK